MPKTDAEWEKLGEHIWAVSFCALLGALVICPIWDYVHPPDAPLDAIIWGAICTMFLAFVVPVVLMIWRSVQRERSQKELQDDQKN